MVFAGRLPACLLTGKLLVVVALDADADHARLVHDLLDHFAALADDFACGVEEREGFEMVGTEPRVG